MTTVLVLVTLVAAVTYGLNRNHVRTREPAGGSHVEDRDRARVAAELAALQQAYRQDGNQSSACQRHSVIESPLRMGHSQAKLATTRPT